ncbi:MAG: winged helix-turn-helix transcriptional regulator [Thaumarchaeota archaeon]|nr:winged helix-turn-helix transcriptional regulator [Nitrososphaerota archaeon]
MIRNKTKKFDYENSMGFVVYSASKMMQKAFDLELRNKTGINLVQSKVVFALNIQSGPTQRELADKIGVESPTLVPIIDKMEQDGYVKRKPDAKDRRIKRIYATAKADSMWDSMMECATQIRKVSTKDLSEHEFKSALAVVKKITENLTVYLHDSETTDHKKAKN